MAEAPESLVLQMLRELRAEISSLRATAEGQAARLDRVDVTLRDLQSELSENNSLFTYGLGMVTASDAGRPAVVE